jgi:Putative Flp pilus-assembly TadE/G-like
MMNPQKISERGQAIVFLVLGFVVFLGFVGLAIDGGMLYSNRRNTKNASDASSLSGGGAAALSLANSAAAGEDGAIYTEWDCTSLEVWEAKNLAVNSAIARAGSNNFTITGSPYDTDPQDFNTATAICGVEVNPSYEDKFIDVYTVISQTTEASFAQVLYPGKLTNVVSATTRVRPMMPFVFGDAIVALNDSCPPGGIEFKGGGTGDSEVHVYGGGLFSNSCIKANGNVDVVIEGDDIDNTCLGEDCWEAVGGATITPEPEAGGPELPAYSYSLDPPNCYPSDPSFINRRYNGGDGTIYPGRYDRNIQITPNATVTMEPGLYCMMGSADFSASGILTGAGVTIYFENGGYTSAGSGTINLSSCMSVEDCETYAMNKVLMYAAHGDVGLRGNGDSDYTGLVYAPDGLIELGGTGSALGEVHVQLVGWDIMIHGDADLNIVYDDAQQLWKSAQIELYR